MKLNKKAMIELGNFLAEKRKEKGYTLEELRLKLKSRGLIAEKSDIQRIENAERKLPNPILLSHLANIYDFDVVEVYKKIGYLPKTEKNLNYDFDKDDLNYHISENIKEYSLNLIDNNIQEIKIYSSLSMALGDFSDVTNSDEFTISLPINEKNKNNTIIGIKEKEKKITIIKKNSEIKNNEIGVFYFNKNWLIATKKISNRGEVFLIDEKKDCPIYVRESDNFRELGKVICNIEFNN